MGMHARLRIPAMIIHLGIDIGGTWIKFGVIDAEGHILFADRARTRVEGQRATLAGIVECATSMADWARRSGHIPVSVGIGSPGTINPSTRKVRPPTPNLTTIIGVNLADLVEDATGLPTAVDNDANCAAWAEYKFGSGRGIDNLICITVGSGIGSGFIVDGHVYSGPNGSGGELGHVTIDWQGNLCPCGNRGCLETFASANAMMRKATDLAAQNPAGLLAQKKDGATVSLAILFECARLGDSAATTVIDESATQLGFGILNAVQIFDPDAVVIGGGAADADSEGIWLSKLAATIHQHAFSVEGKALRIGKAALGNDAGFIGAAALGAIKSG
jgi:glucokinase